MFKKIKKPMAVTGTVALVLSMSTSAFAMGSTAGGLGNSGTNQASQVQSGKIQTLQNQNQTEQSGSQGTNVGLLFGNNQAMSALQGESTQGSFATEIAKAIAALSADDVKTLRDYISAYQEAVEDEKKALENANEKTDLSSYREAVHTALKELLAAAKKANIDLGLTAVGQNGQKMNGGEGQGMNADVIAKAIAALSADDVKTLSDYISAYQEAVEAEKKALENANEKTDLSSYREAVHTALKELLAAAKKANIDLGLMPDGQNGQTMNGSAGQGMNTDEIAKAIDALSDDHVKTLSDYINAYEEAVEKEEEALANADTDRSSYREAVHTALKELLEAAGEANIDF